MADQQTELEFIAPTEFKLSEGGYFEMATEELGEALRKEGELNTNELLNRVLEVEGKYNDRINDQEFAALSVLSYVLGCSRKVLEETVGPHKSKTISRRTMLDRIECQQEAVKVCLTSLDEKNDKPKKTFLRYFRIVTEVFDDYFDYLNPKVNEVEAITTRSFFQGVRGMVSSSFLFKEAGWDVALPEPILDLEHGIDLFVRDSKGRVFAIDVTAKTPRFTEGEDRAFYFHRDVGKELPANITIPQFAGFFRLNVPPLEHNESFDFYEDRASGFPSEKAIAKFMEMLPK